MGNDDVGKGEIDDDDVRNGDDDVRKDENDDDNVRNAQLGS